MASLNKPAKPLSGSTNLTMLLASRLLEVIEESGAAQTEVLAAIGVVQCLLPTLDISAIPPVGEDQAVDK